MMEYQLMTAQIRVHDLDVDGILADADTEAVKGVLRKAVTASKALGELRARGELIPNQGVLINSIVWQ